jgi:hypothetical protein
MSWEAHRWTAKTPSELYHVLGPHGVDDLIRQAIAAAWRDLPGEGRTFDLGVAAARQVFDRNINVWRRIKQPGPEAFFADLQPHAADGFLRQAMVLTWMMMPRTGGREVKDAIRIVSDIFERNMAAWEADNATFTGAIGRKKGQAKRKGAKTVAKDNSKAKSSAAGTGKARRAATAKEDEVAPLRKEMERKLEQAGTKKKSSVGKNG